MKITKLITKTYYEYKGFGIIEHHANHQWLANTIKVVDGKGASFTPYFREVNTLEQAKSFVDRMIKDKDFYSLCRKKID